jgi:Family of unknown function (DUF6496)
MEDEMPLKRTIEKARKDKREGKSPSTQAGEFVREEIDKIRHGEHGARSTKQAIAIGLSEARRAGVKLPPPKRGQVTERTRKSAEYAYEAGQGKRKPRRRPRVSRAVSRALKREPRNTVSYTALSRQAHTAAARRTAAQRSASARQAARTKGAARRSAAGKKAARTRARHRGWRNRRPTTHDKRRTILLRSSVSVVHPLIHADLRSRSLAPAILRAG